MKIKQHAAPERLLVQRSVLQKPLGKACNVEFSQCSIPRNDVKRYETPAAGIIFNIPMESKDIGKKIELVDLEIFKFKFEKEDSMFKIGLYASGIISFSVAYFFLKSTSPTILEIIVTFMGLFGVGFIHEFFLYFNALKKIYNLIDEKKILINSKYKN